MKKGYIVAFLAALALCMGVTFAACGERGYVSGDEVGTYYNDDFGSEYIITLAEKGAVEFQVDGVDEEGSYTLEGAALTISLDGREDISAEFSDRTIKLNFNGKEMVFLEKITYKVTFETNGGSAIDAQRVLNGKNAERPADDPELEHYEFVNWFEDSALTKPLDFGKAITQNTVVYAKWSYVAAKNVLTYDTSNAATEEPSFTVTENESFKLEVPVYKGGDGAAFLGWYTQKDGKGEKLTDETGASLEKWDGRGDITVYAYFAAAYTYTQLDDGTYKVSGNDATKNLTRLDIPAYYQGEAVTYVGDFDGHASVTNVTIPATVTGISVMAFNDMAVLESFEITEVSGVEAAYEVIDGVLYCDGGHTLVKYPVAKKDAEGNPETSFTVPSTVTKIEAYAVADVVKRSGGTNNPGEFYGTLTEILLPDNLTEIGDRAFFERQQMTKIYFGQNPTDGVELTIGDYAFAYIWITEGFQLPSSLVSLGEGAFAYDDTVIHAMKLDGGEAELVLPEGLKTIGAKAFQNNVWITKVTIPSTVTTIGESAFSGCSSYTWGGYVGDEYKYLDRGGIKEIVFAPDSELTEIGASAFSSINGISEVVLPDKVTEIGESAFASCYDWYSGSGLKSIRLPDGLLSVGDSAFRNCGMLESINIPSSVTYFGSSALSDCSSLTMDKIDIPENSKVLYTDGVAIYDVGKTTLMMYPAKNAQSTYTVLEGVKTITEYAFSGVESLEEVVLPDSLTYIGEYAFTECDSLRKIEIPEGVATIESYTFYNASGLSEVHIPASVTAIKAHAFYYAGLNEEGSMKVYFAEGSKLKTIGEEAFSTRNIPSIDLPDGLETIGDGAFSGNAFTELVIPDSVTSIGNSAFSGCSDLATVELPKNLKNFGSRVFAYCSKLQSIDISGENENFKAVNGDLYNKNVTKLIQYAVGKETDLFEIPATVTEIGDYAMVYAMKTNTVRIAENVSAVGSSVWTSYYEYKYGEDGYGYYEYYGVKNFMIDSQAFLNLFTSSAPTDMGEATEAFYVKQGLAIPASATYFTEELVKTDSDKEGYEKYVFKSEEN